MEEKQIKFYETRNGKTPFKQWYLKLDKPIQYQVDMRLFKVKINNYGVYKKLPEGIYELKFKNGIRIYFAEQDRTIILLLLGGNKTRQSDDIKKAQKYLQDYIERNSK